MGEIGDLKISLKLDYIPKSTPTTSSPALDHAWEKLIKSRTIKDK